GQGSDEYWWCIDRIIEASPHVVMDDGADLHARLHMTKRDLARKILGGSEETTTGVMRLRAMEREGVLQYPVIAVNNALTKYLFDNRYGTGQSTIDGILRATNILLAGKTVVIAGYGWVGRGIAMRARGMGARVVVVEVSVEDLERISVSKRVLRNYVTEYTLKNGKKLYLLAEGRLVNLVAAEGHPSEVMDMSFANQALSVEYLVKNRGKLEPRVYNVPQEIDTEVARLKLASLGIELEELTEEQKRYLAQWAEGT
ncbi:MAG: adenosylhomocysteinase, partial [Desulfurococcaceae archaeon]